MHTASNANPAPKWIQCPLYPLSASLVEKCFRAVQTTVLASPPSNPSTWAHCHSQGEHYPSRRFRPKQPINLNSNELVSTPSPPSPMTQRQHEHRTRTHTAQTHRGSDNLFTRNPALGHVITPHATQNSTTLTTARCPLPLASRLPPTHPSI